MSFAVKLLVGKSFDKSIFQNGPVKIFKRSEIVFISTKAVLLIILQVCGVKRAIRMGVERR